MQIHAAACTQTRWTGRAVPDGVAVARRRLDAVLADDGT
jgi:hypothetical protein